MNYIGEFQKDSTILLELLTKDEKNQPIVTDFPPTALIEHYDRNGLQEVDNVTLETMGDGSRHIKLYHIPIDWKYGDYLITYKAQIEGVEYTTQERFYISKTEKLVEENNQIGYEIMNLMTSHSFPVDTKPEEEPVTSADGYIMPPDFQIPSNIQVVDNRIIITINENIKFNHTYRVVLDKEIRSTSGARLGETKTITFTSAYKPLLATPLEVQSVLRSLYKYFTPHDIYSAIRDAGQKAMQLLGQIPDPNNSRYRDMRERDEAYFATTKYVLHEAARILMTGLMVRILNGTASDEEGLGLMTETGGSITLGDFSISNKSSSSSGMGNGENEETPLQKLQAMIVENDRDLKFWQDAMMGRNRRGYARPLSGSYRSGAGSPEGRDF